MQANAANVLRLDKSQFVAIENLIALSGMTERELVELIDAGALAPADPQAMTWTFSADCVSTLRQAALTRTRLGLDIQAMVFTFTLLEQIRLLEFELAQSRAQQTAMRGF